MSYFVSSLLLLLFFCFAFDPTTVCPAPPFGWRLRYSGRWDRKTGNMAGIAPTRRAPSTPVNVVDMFLRNNILYFVVLCICVCVRACVCVRVRVKQL